MTRQITPRLAALGDEQIIINLIKEAAGWLHTKGTDQWAKPWPSRAARDERIRAGLAAKATWIVWDGPTAVATITVRPDGDQRLWTRDERLEPAVYAHRLVVSRDYAGRGIGAALLDWAAERAARSYGASSTRIDVWTTNQALHRYYEGIGFSMVRIADDDSGCPSLALFERPAGGFGRPVTTPW